MYKGDPNLFCAYECGFTKTVGKQVEVKGPHKGYSAEVDGATVTLVGGGHLNFYWQTKGNSKASELAPGDVLEVLGHDPPLKPGQMWYGPNVILRRVSGYGPGSTASLVDYLLLDQ